MKKLRRLGVDCGWPALVAGLATLSLGALAPTEWEHRQSLAVPAAGLVQVNLPPATFDAASANLADLRIVDPSGQETALLLDRVPALIGRIIQPVATTTTVQSGATILEITTGTGEKLSFVDLVTPNPFFLRAATVETSSDRAHWTVLEEGAPIFRQWGAEQLRLNLGGQAAAYVRVTISDPREPALIITGVSLQLAAGPTPANESIASTMVRREEFAGETVLTVDLAARSVPLGEIRFRVNSPLFMRRVQVAVREVRDATTSEHPIATGTIYRVALDGSPPQESTRLPIYYTPQTREIIIHIYNGDSPPLDLGGVDVARLPLNLFFFASAPGTYQLLTGNPQALAPRYDLAAFAGELRGAQARRLTPGPLESTPGYQPAASLAAAPLPDVPLTGAPLDTTAWSQRRSIQMDAPGIQELELDLPALAGARADYADLRLVHNGQQIPYILEQPSLARSLELSPQEVGDAAHRSVSIWKLELPREELPLQNIILRSTSPLFQRQVRIYEKIAASEYGPEERLLAEGEWSRTPQPGVSEIRVFSLNQRVRSHTLWVETDNGDNPPIILGTVEATYPVVRLIFKVAATDSYELVYGNAEASFPRYDLGLVAERLLTPVRKEAKLASVASSPDTRNPLGALRGGFLFWAALGLVVVVLLAVMAKSLPKPAA